MSTLIEKLNWRYAAKRMTGAIIPQEKLDTILEAIQLSPSSAGLQPYTVLVVSDKDIKAKIHAQAAPQPQILESSHLLIFAAWENITAEDVANYMNLIAETRSIPVESLTQFQNSINQNIVTRTEEENFNWASRQAYIALGHAVVAAATEEVDATPMEGFNSEKLDQILDLKSKKLRSVVVLALGYRDQEKDMLSSAKKVRRSSEALFINI
jgi:nitroreductase/dihydropteridine reductase